MTGRASVVVIGGSNLDVKARSVAPLVSGTALVNNNARLGAQLAVEYAGLRG